jgi:hypothetical protein
MTRKAISLSTLAVLACGSTIFVISGNSYGQRSLPCTFGFKQIEKTGDFYRCEKSETMNVNEICSPGFVPSGTVDLTKVGATGWKIVYACAKKPI